MQTHGSEFVSDMIGARLCNLLGDLGYERWQLLDPDSFEWPLQYEETRPLLDWLCSNLRPNNVLAVSEITQYNELCEEGKVLAGEDLDFAFDSISAFAHKRSSQEAVLGVEESVKEINDAVEAYRAEAVQLGKRFQRLQSNFDSLTRHTTTYVQGRRARAATAAHSEQFLVMEEKLAHRNLELNAVLERISSSARELAYYHSGEEDGIYLSFGNFQTFTTQDQACTKALNEWFVKQFDVGPSRLVVEEAQWKGTWGENNVEDDSKLTVKGDFEKTYQNRVSELQRLRSIFGVSERQWVEAQVECAKQLAILEGSKSEAFADQHHMHSDSPTLKRRLIEVEGEVSLLSESEGRLLHQEIPGLCLELAHLQDTYILQGDYDLKVMRQEHYISQQIKFIGLLTNQLSRHRFLHVSCQLERKQMNAACELLRLMETDLQRFNNATRGRIERHAIIRHAAAETQEQGAVDDQDTFLHRVRDILSIHAYDRGGPRMYISALGLVQKITELQLEKKSLQAELNHSLPEDQTKCLNDWCDVIRQVQQLLFASSTTAEPVLSPWPLMQELAEMEVVNSRLSAAIEAVTREHREKAEIVKHHPHEVGRERQVFVDFFQNPDRLRNLVLELSMHVKALRA
ncbi:unnamed protein product [Calypogeia fissa]